MVYLSWAVGGCQVHPGPPGVFATDATALRELNAVSPLSGASCISPLNERLLRALTGPVVLRFDRPQAYNKQSIRSWRACHLVDSGSGITRCGLSQTNRRPATSSRFVLRHRWRAPLRQLPELSSNKAIFLVIL